MNEGHLNKALKIIMNFVHLLNGKRTEQPWVFYNYHVQRFGFLDGKKTEIVWNLVLSISLHFSEKILLSRTHNLSMHFVGSDCLAFNN